MLCNVDKTVCMVFSPSNRRKIVASYSFPEFHLGDTCLKFVCNCRYLGHIISNDQHDDNDIAREIRNLFVRTNILKKNFYKIIIFNVRWQSREFCSGVTACVFTTSGCGVTLLRVH